MSERHVGLIPLTEANDHMNNVQIVQSLPFRNEIGVDIDELQKVLKSIGLEDRFCIIQLRQKDTFVEPQIVSSQNEVATAAFVSTTERKPRPSVGFDEGRVNFGVIYTSDNTQTPDMIAGVINNRLHYSFAIFPFKDYASKLSGTWETKLEMFVTLFQMTRLGSDLFSIINQNSEKPAEFVIGPVVESLLLRYFGYILGNFAILKFGEFLQKKDSLDLSDMGAVNVSYANGRLYYPKDICKLVMRSARSFPLMVLGGEEYFRKI